MSEKKPLIMIVEDNKDIVFNIKLTLEFNNYEVISAENGKEALDKLKKVDRLPEIILSDIMMPEMDGYDFFKYISEDHKLNMIPFIFLTARTSPNDVRFGKMLGVDDYLTKPFEEEDLLAIIAGKINRRKKIESINQNFQSLISSIQADLGPSISREDKNLVLLLIVFWDDLSGPLLKDYFPKDIKTSYSIKEIGQQLFQATVSIYGQDNITKSEGILLNIENIQKFGYIFFDSYPDSSTRSKERQYMIAVISPNITYFQSLKIKEIFEKISNLIKNQEKYKLKTYWKKISELLSTPIVK
ncbi:MAG: response regulator [Candidatus Lokiarchaeota archaeon]|nr:response regulator [Candidatus Lokiarchaeota archaeon]